MKFIKTENYIKLAQKFDGYFHGDAYRLNGNIIEIHGGKFLEAILMEGHRKNEKIVVPIKSHPEFNNKIQGK